MIAGADQDVLRLYVPVDQPNAVRRVEGLRNLSEEVQRTDRVELAGMDQILERRPLHDAHRDEQSLVGLPRLVHRRDMWMVDRGLQASLAPEALAELGVAAQLARQELSATVRSSDSCVAR